MSNSKPGCCNSLCDMDYDELPCWGDVEVVDEVNYGTDDEPDYTWVHACEGHSDLVAYGYPYKPEPKL